MSYNDYLLLFKIGLAATILFLTISIFLFFNFKIPKLIGFLTGTTAKKQIKNRESAQSNIEDMSRRLSYSQQIRSGLPKTSPIVVRQKEVEESQETELLTPSHIYPNENINYDYQINKDIKDSGSKDGDFEIDIDISYINSDEIL